MFFQCGVDEWKYLENQAQIMEADLFSKYGEKC